MDEAFQLILDAPTWVYSADCKLDSRKLVTSIKKLESLDTASLREVVERMVQYRPKGREDKGWDFDQVAKVFFLNRIMFCTPEAISMKGRYRYGGWDGVPYHDGIQNLQWPLRFKPNGEIEVIDCFKGFYGDAYDALGEFESFHESFGRRPCTPGE